MGFNQDTFYTTSYNNALMLSGLERGSTVSQVNNGEKKSESTRQNVTAAWWCQCKCTHHLRWAQRNVAVNLQLAACGAGTTHSCPHRTGRRDGRHIGCNYVDPPILKCHWPQNSLLSWLGLCIQWCVQWCLYIQCMYVCLFVRMCRFLVRLHSFKTHQRRIRNQADGLGWPLYSTCICTYLYADTINAFAWDI